MSETNVPDDIGVSRTAEGGVPIALIWERHGRTVRFMLVADPAE